MNDTDPTSRLLENDHRDLDQQFEAFQATPPPQADRRRELFTRFANDLRHHIDVEERLLFPPFGGEDLSQRVLVDFMLVEHQRIKELLDTIELWLNEGPKPTGELEVELVNTLWAHNAREEGSVYPWFDTHLTADQAMAVRRELHGVPPTDRR
jgi:hemerythrin superfamily protein